MLLNEYQDNARKTALNTDLNHMVFGLVEEAGEAAGILKRFHRGDEQYRYLHEYNPNRREYEKSLSGFAKEKLTAELGDILWYVAMAADALEVRLEDVAAQNVAKLKSRQERNKLTGSGDQR